MTGGTRQRSPVLQSLVMRSQGTFIASLGMLCGRARCQWSCYMGETPSYFFTKRLTRQTQQQCGFSTWGASTPPSSRQIQPRGGQPPPQQHRHQNRSTIYAVIQYNTSTSPTSSSCKEKAQGSRPPKNTAATTFQHVDWLTGPYCSSTFRPWWGVLTRSGVITPYGRVDVGR